MIQPQTESFVAEQNRRFHWETFLPKRRAWIQTLILLPFGLPVGNFLGSSFNFSTNLVLGEGQYLLGVVSMAFNLLLPTIFFACLFYWGWFIWQKHDSPLAWYPNPETLWAGCYATLTIAVSFGITRLFTQSLGVCGNSGWIEIGQAVLCNIDNYGFESKPLFGVWFIFAAYCYQWQSSIESFIHRLLPHQTNSRQPSETDFRSTVMVDGNELTNDYGISTDANTIPPSGES